jgi:sodium pump decarboxylase gamma subunit
MSNLLIALQITALGMGLVFAAIILLWWIMALLTNLMAEKDTWSVTGSSNSDAAYSVPAVQRDFKAEAAAVAVAIALADHQASRSHPLTPPPTAIVSAWQLGMRTKQLYQKGTPVRPPRKVG